LNEAAAAVRWLLEQAEPEARRVAVRQIPKVPGPEALELLRQALGDDDWRVRKEAASAVASLDRREDLVAMLVGGLAEGQNIGLRNAVVEALVAIGPAAISPTIEAFGRIDADGRKLAVEVLGGIPDGRGTRALANALRDEDANVRVTAAESLGNASLAGEDARDEAIAALSSTLVGKGDPLLRLAALGALARLEAALPWALIEPCAHDPLLRRYAIAAAARIREPAAVRALAEAVGDPAPAVARAAIVALGDLVAESLERPELLSVARETLATDKYNMADRYKESLRKAAHELEDARLRGSALLALGLLREAADVPLLAEALGHDDVAQRADIALRLSGPQNLGALLDAVRHAAPVVRASALSLATSLEGGEAEAALVRGALRDALADDSPEVIACALAELGELGDATDLRALSAMASHGDPYVVDAACSATTSLASRNVEAARALLRDADTSPLVACILLAGVGSTEPLREAESRLLEGALAVDDPLVRRAAIEALAQSGGEGAADAVVFALADEERDVQLAALRALGHLGQAETLAGVVAEPSDPVLTSSALRALGQADPERALAASRRLVSHPEAALAASGVEALGALRALPRLSDRCDDALLEALDHGDAEVVKLALSLLGGHPTFRAIARIGLALDHPSWEVRRMAAEILSQDRSPASQEFLRARYEREPDPSVREALAEAVSIRPPSRDSSRPRVRVRGGEGT
jgi:HEAT repeat protein